MVHQNLLDIEIQIGLEISFTTALKKRGMMKILDARFKYSLYWKMFL